MDVWLHKALPPHPTVNDFAGLADLPDNKSVNNMISATYNYSPGGDSLQLNKGEQQLVAALHGQSPSKAQVVSLWSQILNGRVNEYLNGSLANVNYSSNSALILPLAEARSLLRSDPKVYREFQPMLAGTPAFNQHRTAPSQLYYECFDIEDTACFGTGAVYLASSPATIQHADVEYFVSSGIYASRGTGAVVACDDRRQGRDAGLARRHGFDRQRSLPARHGTARLRHAHAPGREAGGGRLPLRVPLGNDKS